MAYTLYYTPGTASLAVGEFQLALSGLISSWTLAEKFGNAEDGGQRIV